MTGIVAGFMSKTDAAVALGVQVCWRMRDVGQPTRLRPPERQSQRSCTPPCATTTALGTLPVRAPGDWFHACRTSVSRSSWCASPALQRSLTSRAVTAPDLSTPAPGTCCASEGQREAMFSRATARVVSMGAGRKGAVAAATLAAVSLALCGRCAVPPAMLSGGAGGVVARRRRRPLSHPSMCVRDVCCNSDTPSLGVRGQ